MREFPARTAINPEGDRVTVSFPVEILDALGFETPYRMIAKFGDYGHGVELKPDDSPVEETEAPVAG